MGRINWGRVFVGGLVAGLIINLFEYVTNGVVLAANWGAPMKALGRHLPASAIPVFIVGGFIAGSRQSGYMQLLAHDSAPAPRPQH